LLSQIFFQQFDNSGNYYTTAKIDLQSCRVKIYGKSALKFQNTSVIAPGDDEDSVNNVPLEGRRYAGSGQITRYKNYLSTTPNGMTYLIGNNSGLMTQIGFTASDPSLLEPPKPELWTGVTRTDKVRIQPGDIKTSIIKCFNNMRFQSLFDQTYNQYFDKQRFSPGKFCLWAIEKVLDWDASEVQAVYEIQNDIDVKISYVTNPRSSTFFEKPAS